MESSCQDASNTEYILSLDTDDSSISEYTKAFQSMDDKVRLVENNNQQSAIHAINNAAKLTQGKILIVVSDDFDCPLHWDEKLRTALKDKEDFVVKTKDGLQPFIITLPIMDRVYYNRFGYIYYPEYKHMYSDTDMSCVGHMLDRTITLDIHFPHRHYSNRAMAKDVMNVKNDSTYKQGEIIFKERKKINFGIEHPLKQCPI